MEQKLVFIFLVGELLKFEHFEQNHSFWAIECKISSVSNRVYIGNNIW